MSGHEFIFLANLSNGCPLVKIYRHEKFPIYCTCRKLQKDTYVDADGGKLLLKISSKLQIGDHFAIPFYSNLI